MESVNNQNFSFYENISPATFDELSVKAGLNNCADIKCISDELRGMKSILELGAGTGRVVKCVKLFNKRHKITALEVSKKLFKALHNRYKDSVNCIQADFKDSKLTDSFDLILWMWSGIIDFSKEEQAYSLQKCFHLLKPSGTVVIDVPKIGFKTIAEHEDDQNLTWNTEFGTLKCYIPKKSEIVEYLTGFDFTIESEEYYTDTNRQRQLYKLYKN